MKLHARNIAVNAGATGEEADRIAQKMAEEGNISVSRAKELLGK
jgi:hydroxymethylglutaryl-CoA reductase